MSKGILIDRKDASTSGEAGFLPIGDEQKPEAGTMTGEFHAFLEEPEQSPPPFSTKAWGSAFHGFQETYPISMTIDSKIIEFSDTTVTLECLMVPSERVFQERIFPRDLLEGIPVRLGQFVQIRIFQKPLKILHTFFDGSKLVNKERFEEYKPMLSDEEYENFE